MRRKGRLGRARRSIGPGVAVVLTALVATTAAASTGGGLMKYLPTRGEETGYSITKTQTYADIAQFVKGESKKEAATDTKRLTTWGFQAGASEFLKDAAQKGQAGASVSVFETAAGARKDAAYYAAAVRHQGKGAYQRLSLSNVHAMHGWAYTTLNEKGSSHGDVNVYWVEGRCSLWVGNSTTGQGVSPAPVLSAVEAIEARTAGICS